ncbi:MAG TPA: pyridoxal-phosphate dependent enzyme [Actinomycetota bacterium]|nr:pyridoxal-phosphate dependent enzyme [Actinomycetota bacterium]
MRVPGLDPELADRSTYDRAVERLREAEVVLPTFEELADPAKIPQPVREGLAGVGADEADPRNLFRVHWYNDGRGGQVDPPAHLTLPGELTGVDATIVVALGDRFPMIDAHKVLAAYGCLVPRVVTGRFDPTADRAIWPSTGNYCRGGVAISRIMGCRGVAVLPEGMSRERFAWLESWVAEPEDIIRTPGSESNVKEIYDKCAELAEDPQNVILNQFSEFGNYLAHYACTGPALERVVESLGGSSSLRAFVAASGSAGTLGAGDYLKDRHGSLIVAAEALECPTMLSNGFGEHNIQGIGDKHIPFIHNVMNTDVVVAVSDEATDQLGVLFGTDTGRAYLADRRGVPQETLAGLDSLGLSGICNILSAIKTAKYYELSEDDVVVTVATDGSAMYASEREKTIDSRFGGDFDTVSAGETFARFLLGATTDHLRELRRTDRERIFNLGYFTWVEQQGVSLEDFTARKDQAYWKGIRETLPVWDGMIREFNARTGQAA